MIDLRNIGILVITITCIASSYFLTWRYLIGFIVGILWMIFMLWFQKETVAMLHKLYTIKKNVNRKYVDNGKIVRRKLRK